MVFDGTETGDPDSFLALCAVLGSDVSRLGALALYGHRAKDPKIAERAAALLDKNLKILENPENKNRLLCSIGDFYMWGRVSSEKGAEFYEAALRNDPSLDLPMLTGYCKRGKKYDRLLQYYENRVKGGFPVPPPDYAMIFINGLGVERDCAKAVEILSAPPRKNGVVYDEASPVWLYTIYSEGRCVP